MAGILAGREQPHTQAGTHNVPACFVTQNSLNRASIKAISHPD